MKREIWFRIAGACVIVTAIVAFIVGGFRLQRDDALMDAATHGDAAKVTDLLKSGADVNYCFEGNVTPLSMASGNGHEDVVRILLDYGADPTIAEHDGQTAMSQAATSQIRGMIRSAINAHHGH